MLKIEPSEITSFLYSNLFRFRRGDVPCVPPGGAYVIFHSHSFRQCFAFIRGTRRGGQRSSETEKLFSKNAAICAQLILNHVRYLLQQKRVSGIWKLIDRLRLV